MPTCADCKHFKPLEGKEGLGDCFGHEVPGSLDAEKCPAKAFAPKE